MTNIPFQKVSMVEYNKPYAQWLPIVPDVHPMCGLDFLNYSLLVSVCYCFFAPKSDEQLIIFETHVFRWRCVLP
jgi:hypothetical protein